MHADATRAAGSSRTHASLKYFFWNPGSAQNLNPSVSHDNRRRTARFVRRSRKRQSAFRTWDERATRDRKSRKALVRRPQRSAPGLLQHPSASGPERHILRPANPRRSHVGGKACPQACVPQKFAGRKKRGATWARTLPENRSQSRSRLSAILLPPSPPTSPRPQRLSSKSAHCFQIGCNTDDYPCGR